MDIRQWLQETTYRAPPAHPGTPTVPDFLGPQPEGQNRPSHVRRGRRKRASSDSSLIRPRRGWHGSEVADHRPAAHSQQNDAAAGLEDRSISRASSQVNHHTYERRPRHKTKPDRYEPKQNKQRKDRELKHTDRRTRKHRKSHRHDNDYHRPPVLLHSLHSKNGPKNSRLTLKPDTHTGLFKHGRAGERVAGCGTGLPDLVFNELKFLQKPTEHQDEPARADSPPRGKRHERKRVQDEEISAYFNANNGAKSQSQLPQEKVQHREESQDPKRNRDLEEAQPVRRSATQVESGGKALEPGRPAAGARRHESAEPYPWSESPVNQPTQARPQPGQTIKKRQPRKDRSSFSRHSARFELAREISRDPQTAVLGSVLNDNFQASKGRVDRSTSDEEKRIAPPRNEQRLHRPASIITAHSRPQDASQHRGTKQDELEQVADGLHLPRDFQTSDILEIREPRQHSDKMESFGRVHVESDKENASPRSSVDQLLDQVKQAIVRRSTAPQGQLHGAKTPRESLAGREVGIEADVSGAIEHPPLRQALEHYERATTNLSCIGLRSVRNMSMGVLEHGKALHSRDLDNSMPEAATFEHALPTEHEMLDDGSLVDDNPCRDDYADLQNPGANDVVRRVFAVPETRLFEKQAEQMWEADEMDSEEWSAMEHARRSEASLEPQDEAMEAMAGFWKPHRLY